jgi:hypothetical protein
LLDSLVYEAFVQYIVTVRDFQLDSCWVGFCESGPDCRVL